MTTPQPCGAIRVVRWFEGMAQVEAWCARTAGPCPYPGAGLDLQRNGRLCVVDYAQLNPALVGPDCHDDHAGMFPESCERCAAEWPGPLDPPPSPLLCDPDMLIERRPS